MESHSLPGLDGRDVVGGICGHPSPDPHQDGNELVAKATGNSSPGAARPQTITPDIPQDRTERRKAALEALNIATVIDLTDEAAKAPPIAGVIDLMTNDTPPGWERLAVCPTLLVTGSDDSAVSFVLKDGRWTDSDGRKLNKGVCPCSIDKVVLRPSIGYPTKSCLYHDNQCGFTGKYGANRTGRISISRRELKAIIRQEGGEDGFIAFVWFPE
jgi:hypothetical protein